MISVGDGVYLVKSNDLENAPKNPFSRKDF